MKTNDLNIQIDALFKHWLISSNRNDKIIVENFIFILENNLIKLNKVERDSFFNIYIFNEFYSNDRKIIINLLKKLNNFFEIIKINKNEILIFFENRLFKIYFKKKFPKKIISIKSYFIFFYKIKYLYSPNYILSYLNIYLSRIINKNKTYLLTYNDFLKLNMFDKGISYNLRVKNMNLINNKGKIIYIKDILNFFKNKNKQKKISKVFFNKDLFYKSLNSNIPTYINLNYWRSSNFYLISNIIYGFFQKGFQYETQTLKNNFYKTFSSKINLIKDIDKINKLVTSSDLIIINNNPYSSRNRLLAMIGHILNGGEYINFKYKKYFDQSIFKQRLINLFAEHFSIYKYKNALISNLDSNYKKIFEDRGIFTTYNDDIKSCGNKLEVTFNTQHNFKNFQFIEVDSFFDLPLATLSTLSLLFLKKSKSCCFYLDNKNKCSFFSKKEFLKHSIKILYTVIILKPKILIVIEKC